jgi:EAL domain-containing protein (putative c-di-GMP-specific phosphodiesterase class I)
MSVGSSESDVRRAIHRARNGGTRQSAPSSRRSATRVVQRIIEDPLQLIPLFQPILSLVSGRIVGYEALARLRSDFEHAPAQVFGRAHELGFGAELEALAVRRALDVASAAGFTPDTFVSVNVSPLVLGHPALWAVLRSRDLRQVVIELTEDDAVDDYRALRRVMRRYLDRGVRFAIDDAGAGFASMRHLTELWPTYFKLDALLTRGLGRDQRRQALVRALATLATDVGATLIVEGVEHTEDLMHLARTRLPILVQGYAVARPSPPWPSVSRAAAKAIISATSRPTDSAGDFIA